MRSTAKKVRTVLEIRGRGDRPCSVGTLMEGAAPWPIVYAISFNPFSRAVE